MPKVVNLRLNLIYLTYSTFDYKLFFRYNYARLNMTERFNQASFELGINISRLGLRERNAIRVIFQGFREIMETGIEQKRIKIIKSQDKEFDLDLFGNVMTQMNAELTEVKVEKIMSGSDMSEEITFQPIIKDDPCLFPLRELISSQEATDHFITNFLRLPPSNTKPQK